jgi:cytochrome P450
MSVDAVVTSDDPEALVMALLGQPDDPYPLYHRLRATAPHHHSELGVRFVSTYAGCVELLRSPSFESTFGFGTDPGDSTFLNAVKDMLVISNPPQHTRLRRLVVRAFQPKMVEALAPKVTSLVDGHLDRMAELGPTVDAMAELAQPLPAQVLCELLGVPYSDHPLIQEWSDAVARAVVAVVPPDVLAEAERVTTEFHSYIRELLRQRRRNPGPDLTSALVQVEEDGDRLSEVELVNLLFTLLLAGSETTTSLLSSGMWLLLRRPDQARALREDPGLMDGALDEMLRYESPIQNGFSRIAVEDVEVAGRLVRRGEPAVALLGAAHRDESVFPDPDVFDIRRDGADRHIAFGSGIHFCIGRGLGRQQGAIAIGRLLARFPSATLADSSPRWQKTFPSRRLARLDIQTEG